MLKLFIKLDKNTPNIEVSAQRGKEILNMTKYSYQKDLADKIILGLARSISSVQTHIACPERSRRKGLDKNLKSVRIKKQEQIRSYLMSESESFVSNLIGNSVVSVFNWLEKKK